MSTFWVLGLSSQPQALVFRTHISQILCVISSWSQDECSLGTSNTEESEWLKSVDSTVVKSYNPCRTTSRPWPVNVKCFPCFPFGGVDCFGALCFWYLVRIESLFYFILLFFPLGKRATASCLYLCCCTPWRIRPESIHGCFHHTFSTQHVQKQGVPGLLSSTEIFIFPLYYTWVAVSILCVNSDEEKENICTFIYSTWQLSNKDTGEGEIRGNRSWFLY